MTHLTIRDMSPLTRRMYTVEKDLVSTSGQTLGSKITFTLLGRVMFLCVSLLTHAEAVCRAVYLSFLMLKSLFMKVDPRKIEAQKERCIAAYRVSLVSLAACLHAKVLFPAEKPLPQPSQPKVPTQAPAVKTQPQIHEAEGVPARAEQREGVPEHEPEEAAPAVEPVAAPPSHSDEEAFEFLSQPESPVLVPAQPESPVFVPAPGLIAPSPRRSAASPDEMLAAAAPGDSPEPPLLNPDSLGVINFFNSHEEFQRVLDQIRKEARTLVHEPRKGFNLQPDSPSPADYYSPDWYSCSPIVGFPVGICHSVDNGPRMTSYLAVGFNLTIHSQEVPVHLFGFFETPRRREASHFLTTHIQSIISAHLEKHVGALTDQDVANIINVTLGELGEKFRADYPRVKADATLALIIGNYLFTVNLSGGGMMLMQNSSMIPLALERGSHDLENRTVVINCQEVKDDDLFFIALPGFFAKCSLVELGEVLERNGRDGLKDLAHHLANSVWAFNRTAQQITQRSVGICLVHIKKAGVPVIGVGGDRAEYHFVSPLATPREPVERKEDTVPSLDRSLDSFPIPEEEEKDGPPAPLPVAHSHDGAAFASPAPNLAAFVAYPSDDNQRDGRARSDGVLVRHYSVLPNVEETGSQSSGDSISDVVAEARASVPPATESSLPRSRSSWW